MLETTVNSQFQFDKTLLLWVTVKTESGAIYYIVRDILRTKYQLWKGKKKTKWESDNPLSLYDKIKLNKGVIKMTKEEISKKIEELETQYAELDRQEREKTEIERKKRAEEKDKELSELVDSVKAFNEKYGENVLLLTQKDTRNLTLNELFFPWL